MPPFLISALLNPKIIITVVLISVSGYFIWSTKSKYDNALENAERLEQELTIEQNKVAMLNSELENKQEIVNAIEENMQRMDEINRSLYNRIEYNNSLVRNLRSKMDSIDFESLMQNDPESVSEIFTNAWKRRLNCIEAASGKQIECID